jgi:formylglycine-generating enzyme required for sulfatase activity
VEGTDGTSVTAVPDYGYHFVQWSDGSTDNPRTDLNVLSDITVEATFAINVYTLTYTAGADGSVTGDTPQQITHGEDGTAVEAVADADCYFLQWSDGRTDNPRTDTAVVRNQQIMAIFRSNTKTILLPGDVPMILRRIPPGTFTMGSETTEQGHDATEGPTREVTFGYEYFVGKYPVTQQQWLALMGTWPGAAPDVANGLGNNYPAYHISWADAQAFVTALNAHITATGQGEDSFRLPSEAEWEYACRAGSQTRFHFGDSLGVDDLCEDDGARGQNMWYCGNNTIPGTKAVGQQLPNPYDLCDTHGNVREWCEDDWHDTYDNAPVDGAAWNEPIRGTSRVVRGGHWDSNAADCRAAARDNETPDYVDATLGFRLCLGYPVGSGEHIGVWHNVIFGGPGYAGGLIYGNVRMSGSVCLLGDSLPEGAVAMGYMDLSGSAGISNTYLNIDPFLKARIPSLPIIEYAGDLVTTLNAKLRVKNGLVALSGTAAIGMDYQSGSGYKGPVDAVYVTDGWGGNQGATNVYSDNGTEQPYDLGNRLKFPLLNDDWRNPDGTRVHNFSTGTWYTHEEYFSEVLVGEPDVPDDCIYEGDMTLTAYQNPGLYFNATTGEELTGTNTLAVTPNPEHSYILTRRHSNVIFVNGQIKINGNLAITGKAQYDTFYYSGKAAIMATGTTLINANLLTVNNGNTEDIENSFPDNCLAVMSKGNMTSSPTIQCVIMGAFYSEQNITVPKQIQLAGSCVARDF